MATRLERPRFFEGQYIGSSDLEAVIAYARDTAREHALGGHSWGVATGLELIESATEGGGVDYFVLPGLGWDGYGRPIVLLEPKQVPAAKFAGLPSGDQTVWLRYNEAPFQGLRPGFETCSAEQSYSRIRESVEVEVGSFGLSEREGGIEIAGIASADARLAPRLFGDEPADSADNKAPLLCDGSVPHQGFPGDTERWLVPIGVATWQNGAPGTLTARSEASLKTSRTQRRMAGVVGESLFAADGIIRLRDRYKQFQAGVSLDSLCDPVKAEDFVQATDATDSNKKLPRLVGKELVWVEGNMRVTGHARLFGTRLELRDGSGAEAGSAPLYARRAVSANNSQQGQDFQIVIGEQSDGKHRFSVGPGGTEYGPIQERFVVASNGLFAFGSAIPTAAQPDTGLIAASGGASLALAGNAGDTSRFAFRALPGLTDLAHIGFDGATGKLRAGVGADLARFTYWSDTGNVGIGTSTPASQLHIAAGSPKLRLESTGGADVRMEFVSDTTMTLTHQASNDATVLRHGGFESMSWFQDRVGVNLAGLSPSNHLHVRGTLTGAATSQSNHVALIENTGGSNAHVLALRVTGTADANNNFITFFDASGAIGRIERSTTVAPLNPASAGTFLRLLSGGADFAECLPRPSGTAPIGAGRIVGVRRGEVSLETEGADSLMITTDRAVVVGNAVGGSEAGETVALIGQVWARVAGPVESGDFILPSGRNDGTGRAVSPHRLSPGEAPMVVGRAWSDCAAGPAAPVKVAVGMQGADALSALATALSNQQRTIEALTERLSGAGPSEGG